MCSTAVTSFPNQNLKATVGCHTLCLLQNRSNFPLQTGDCSWAGGRREGGRERETKKGSFCTVYQIFLLFLLPSFLQFYKLNDSQINQQNYFSLKYDNKASEKFHNSVQFHCSITLLNISTYNYL